jgi:heterotetrameric sarcosine oxidase gamma subunit
VTDAPRFKAAPSETLLRLELWSGLAEVRARFEARFGAPLPSPNRATSIDALRVIWREPGAWMIRGSARDLDALTASLTEVAGSDGAVTDISGAVTRCILAGADWRILLTHGGVFDAEDPAFAPGCVAGTVVEHMAVRFDVISQVEVDVYVAPSYAADLFVYWSSAARGLDVTG